MINLKEAYNQIEYWYQHNDVDMINFLVKSKFFNRDSKEYKFVQTIDWYNSVNSSKEKNLILGDKIISLEEIKNFVLETHIVPQEQEFKKMEEDPEEYGNYIKEECNNYYDSCGYGTPNLVKEIRRFWENLTSDAVFFISEETANDKYDIDLDGGRLYLSKGLEGMAFNYVYYTFKESLPKEKFKEWYKGAFYGLHDVYLPNKETLKEMYDQEFNKEHLRKIEHFNKMIDDINHNFKNDNFFNDKLETIKQLKIK